MHKISKKAQRFTILHLFCVVQNLFHTTEMYVKSV